MKLLLDSMMSEKFGKFFSGHKVTHVVDLNWQHLNNGKLLEAAEAEGFEVSITKEQICPTSKT